MKPNKDEEVQIVISEEQQQIVLERVRKYELNPELMISEEEALKLIAEMQ